MRQSIQEVPAWAKATGGVAAAIVSSLLAWGYVAQPVADLLGLQTVKAAQEQHQELRKTIEERDAQSLRLLKEIHTRIVPHD